MALVKGPEEGKGVQLNLEAWWKTPWERLWQDSFYFFSEATCVECGKAGWKRSPEGPQ